MSLRRASPLPSTHRVLRPFLTKRWPALAVAMASTVVVAAADLARPFPLKLIVDRIVGSREAPFALGSADLWLVAGIGALVLAIALADAVASYQMDVQLRRAGEHIVQDLRTGIYDHLQRLSLAFHDRRQAGELVTGVTGDVNAVGSVFSESLGEMVSSVLFLVGMVVVTALLDPVLALTGLAVVPILGLLSFRFRRTMRDIAREQRARDGEIASLATESLSAMRVVKALGTEQYERVRLRAKGHDRLTTAIRGARVQGRFAGFVDVLGAVGSAAVLVVGVFRVAKGALTAGDLIVMASYAKRMYKPLRDIARHANKISQASARADRVAEILSADEILEERSGSLGGPPAQGHIELRGVSFAYEPERPVLSDVSLQIPAGQKVAIMGPSGAGKSTIGSLIARFYDPDAGSVLVDGRDERDCSLAWLRGQIGFLLQDTVLFTGTVAENIAYGLEVSREEIVRAARAAGAEGFVDRLPDGYDTPLGARGVALSGGQRQRIAIARTLLRNPPILVLDEPTTGLDEASEREVLRGLDTLMAGRTTIVITHSPDLAGTADRILVVDGGSVVEAGPTERSSIPARFTARAVAPASRLPRDDALPAMATLLDSGAMTPVLARSLGWERWVSGIRVSRVSYRPGSRLVVHYLVEVDGTERDAVAMVSSSIDLSERADKPGNVAMARSVNGRSPAVTPLTFDPELGALIQWFPLDLSMPGLAAPVGELAARLRPAGVLEGETDREPVPLRYKARRRASLRLGDHVLRFYAREPDFRRGRAALLATTALSAVATADFEASDVGMRVTVQSHVPGRSQNGAIDQAERAGALLWSLHATEPTGRLASYSPAAQLRAAASTAGFLTAVLPELRPGLDRLLAQLGETLPRPPGVFSHGDFNHEHLIDVGGKFAVLDFDHLAVAPAALDLATYPAHLMLGRAGEMELALGSLERMIEGYGYRPDGIGWYLSTSILRRSARPFRHCLPDWREAVRSMVGAADAARAA